MKKRSDTKSSSVVVTPQVFYDLFMLCLSWQAVLGDQQRDYTTVDKVARILEQLGILSPKERASIFRNKPLQGLFLRHAIVIKSGTELLKRNKEGERTLQDTTSRIIIEIPPVREMNRERMLRDYRIHLNDPGVTYARSIEASYASVLTRDTYVDEDLADKHRRGGEKPPVPVARKYRDKVEKETGDERPL